MPIEHIHPMLVHFPIVLALLALAFDLWWFAFGRNDSQGLIRLQTGTVVMTLGGIAAVVAFVFGDMAYDIAVGKGVATAVLETHEGWGTTTAIVFAAVAAVRLVLWRTGIDRQPAGALVAIAATAVVAVMVVVTAYFGGHLVYDLGINVTGAMK
ncbi:MAG: hypothetical protein KDC18_00995 [Alphaproteobacteria bacterium]|nr:hypothetical protein [Alphaproteobacteria bacterium]MCB9930573.1 hypothetical protein [Alphaproteobacteria bacterium]